MLRERMRNLNVSILGPNLQGQIRVDRMAQGQLVDKMAALRS
jgi:hypothetical protein